MTRADNFSARITQAPRAYDEAKGVETASILASEGMAEAGEDSPLRAVLRGAAGSSTYLAGLIEREATWAMDALTKDPESVFSDILAEIRAVEGEAARVLDPALRLGKRRGALLIALADLGGVWDFEAVTDALTDLADTSMEVAARTHISAQQAADRLPASNGDALDSGYVLMAMGKHGARELNYSSDIDVIPLFDETQWDPSDYAYVKTGLVRATRGLVKSLSESTADGYVFRTDLRLRPDPGSTPICLAMESAERYYEMFGRTWERSAYIKARAAACDKTAGDAFLERLQPFVWRRHLDFAMVEDAMRMRQAIRKHKGHGALEAPGHDIKIGAGGIREIEFLAQTQQLILGGREPSLRNPTTRGALRALTEGGWIDEGLRETLDAAYVAHRTLEHRIQMLEDAQTHIIPSSEEGLERIAALGGWPDVEAFTSEVTARMHHVHSSANAFYEETGPGGGAGEDVTANRLVEQGFSDPERAEAALDRWRSGALAATRSDRARDRLNRLAPMIFKEIGESQNPDETLAQFDRFLSGLPAGVQLFSLFEANPHLLELTIEICAAAPHLAEYLSHNSAVFEAVLTTDFFAPPPPRAAIEAELLALLDDEDDDYERQLDAIRRWAKEHSFQVGVQILRGHLDARTAGHAYSNIAEAALRVLHPLVEREFTRRHGPPPGRGAVVLGLGRLGGREMTATSDLDLIIVYDAAGEEGSDGPRPLSSTPYYARFTQALISALTAPTAEGRLYEVDMRLRPSGRSGPVATALDAFRRYQAEQAWTWEHMALSRARVVAGPPAMAEDVEDAMRTVLSAPRDEKTVMKDALEMRARIDEANAKLLQDQWALKHTRGGLVDIEFIAQVGVLVNALKAPRNTDGKLEKLAECGWLSAADATVLRDAYALQATTQQAARVVTGDMIDPETAGAGLRDILAKATGSANFEALGERLASAQKLVRERFSAIIG